MNSRIAGDKVWLLMAMGTMVLALTVSVSAQVKTETTTTSEAATKEISVERGEVVHVTGNDLVVRMEDGTIRHFANVPESARATVDGRQVGIHDLKPGMKLERTLTVTTTPKIITTVKTVTGKVWHVTPPSSVILTLEDGTTQGFKIPAGQKFTIDGQQVDAWGLKKGMQVSATKIVEEPQTVVEREQRVTGSTPPPPAPPQADAPILIAAATPAPTTQAIPQELPKTGSTLPLVGLLGALALMLSLGLKAMRRMF